MLFCNGLLQPTNHFQPWQDIMYTLPLTCAKCGAQSPTNQSREYVLNNSLKGLGQNGNKKTSWNVHFSVKHWSQIMSVTNSSSSVSCALCLPRGRIILLSMCSMKAIRLACLCLGKWDLLQLFLSPAVPGDFYFSVIFNLRLKYPVVVQYFIITAAEVGKLKLQRVAKHMM